MNAPFRNSGDPVIDLRVDAEMHVASLQSAVDGLKRIALVSPTAVRSTFYFLNCASDELRELTARLGD